MLNHLHISNFAIVPALDQDFHPGFTAITGETGAGKSILVDALGLLLGDRADASWVRPGAERAELSAEFSVAGNSGARNWLEQSELSAGDHCLLRRTINAGGRSRAFINGSPVTLAQLKTLGDLLVEIHGQHEHLRLAETAEQFRLLDNRGNDPQALAEITSAYTQWKKITAALDALEKDVSVSATELEFLEFQLAELDQHDLSDTAMTALQTEHDRLAAGGTLLDTLNLSIESMEPESASTNSGINTDLNSTLGRLQQFASLDTDIKDACQMLQEAAVNCTEAVNALRAARDRVDLNPERFESIAGRLGQLGDLARKHRVRMNDLGDVRDELAARIERAGSSEIRRRELETELSNCLASYRKAALHLHEQRVVQARTLSDRVSELMVELGMAGGIFEFTVTLDDQEPPSPRGDDKLQITISANPGVPAGPLQKIASGGELSRISLAIKVAARGGNEAVTQIFDEVDAGIGGETANSVGRLLQRLSEDNQVLCVTHLAQVAVCAQQQLRVRKASDQDSTTVDTRLLDAAGRVEEIARMLSGRLSEQSRAHALELLDAASAN